MSRLFAVELDALRAEIIALSGLREQTLDGAAVELSISWICIDGRRRSPASDACDAPSRKLQRQPLHTTKNFPHA